MNTEELKNRFEEQMLKIQEAVNRLTDLRNPLSVFDVLDAIGSLNLHIEEFEELLEKTPDSELKRFYVKHMQMGKELCSYITKKLQEKMQ